MTGKHVILFAGTTEDRYWLTGWMTSLALPVLLRGNIIWGRAFDREDAIKAFKGTLQTSG